MTVGRNRGNVLPSSHLQRRFGQAFADNVDLGHPLFDLPQIISGQFNRKRAPRFSSIAAAQFYARIDAEYRAKFLQRLRDLNSRNQPEPRTRRHPSASRPSQIATGALEAHGHLEPALRAWWGSRTRDSGYDGFTWACMPTGPEVELR